MVGDNYFRQLDRLLSSAKNDAQLLDLIVNSPFRSRIRATRMDLGIVVLLLVNKKDGTIDRVALSDTELAAGAVRMSEKPFKEIKIPLGHPENSISKAIDSGQPQYVTDWKDIFVPTLSPRAARFNQAGSGIEFSCVYPLKAHDGGALIFSYYQEGKNIKDVHHEFIERYSQMADKYLKTASDIVHLLGARTARRGPKEQGREVPPHHGTSR